MPDPNSLADAAYDEVYQLHAEGAGRATQYAQYFLDQNPVAYHMAAQSRAKTSTPSFSSSERGVRADPLAGGGMVIMGRFVPYWMLGAGAAGVLGLLYFLSKR